jgi:N-acyl amino acid synthase of PEP-CTERM/exosortase system
MRLGLVQGLVRISQELGLTHWCAVMEPSLFATPAEDGHSFRAACPTADYHGIRQPCYAAIDPILRWRPNEPPNAATGPATSPRRLPPS